MRTQRAQHPSCMEGFAQSGCGRGFFKLYAKWKGIEDPNLRWEEKVKIHRANKPVGSSHFPPSMQVALLIIAVVGALAGSTGLFVSFAPHIKTQVPLTCKIVLCSAGGGMLVVALGTSGFIVLRGLYRRYHNETLREKRAGLIAEARRFAHMEDAEHRPFFLKRMPVGTYFPCSEDPRATACVYLLGPLRAGEEPAEIRSRLGFEHQLEAAGLTRHDPFPTGYRHRYEEEKQAFQVNWGSQVASFEHQDGEEGKIWTVLTKEGARVKTEIFTSEHAALLLVERKSGNERGGPADAGRTRVREPRGIPSRPPKHMPGDRRPPAVPDWAINAGIETARGVITLLGV